jgi:hypothetical protein
LFHGWDVGLTVVRACTEDNQSPGLRIGKTRGNVDLNLRWEIFKDFFWGVGVYYTYDGQAETEEASDYGSFISLGWKF